MSYSSEVLADTPAVYYLLDDTGSTAVDSSGGSHSGTLNGGVTTGVAGAIATQGAANKAMSFDGVNDYIGVVDNIWGSAVPISVEFWVKPTASNPVGIFDGGPGVTNIPRQYSNGQIDWQGGPTANMPALSTTDWTHVVAVFKSNGGNRRILIYINGALNSTTDQASGTTIGGTTNWRLGNINNGGNGWFSGALDEFAVYLSELSAARIAVHYNAAFVFAGVTATAKAVARVTPTIIPKGQLGVSGARPKDATLPYIGHLYDNRGTFKRLLDPFLNRPMLKQTLNGGFQPITLDMPLPVRLYADVVGGEAPNAYFRLDDATGAATDLVAGISLPVTTYDRSAGMSFGNDSALGGSDKTTSLKNSVAVPTTGYIFGASTVWDDSQPANWSIEFMFKTTGQSNRFYPMFHHLGTGDFGDCLQIYIGPQGNTGSTTYGTGLQWFLRAPNAGTNFFSNTGHTPTPNVWHHLILVNANGTITLYVDGVSVNSVATGQPVPRLNRGFLACAHPGSMQELAIYGAALSSGQATAHNTARTSGAYPTTIKADSPLGYWRLGEPIGALVADAAVSQIRLQLKAPVYAQAPLINDDKSMQFGNKDAGDELSTNGGGYFSSTTPRPITGTKFSIEAWIKPGSLQKDRVGAGGESYPGGRAIAVAGNITGASDYLSLAQNGPDIIVGYPSNQLVKSNVLTTGKHHVVWVHDSAIVGAPDTIYVDGKPVGTGNLAAPAPAAGLAIGNQPSAQDAIFGGLIDEVAFWNEPLPQARVQAHYQAGIDMTQGDIITLTEQGGDGTVLYKGIVEDIPDDYDLAPNFQIGIQPMVVELADSFFTHNYNVPTDIGQMVQDAIDATGHLTWNGVSVPITGILAQVDFTDTTALAVLEHCKKIGGPYFWWFVDQNGLVWFQQFDLTKKAMWSTKMGVDHNARRYRSPIGNLKNKVLCVGNIPPNGTVPITSLYNDLASQAQYGLRTLWPPLVYPNIVDQPTLDKVQATVGAELNRRVTKVELELPAFSLILLGVNGGATMRYWEPNKNPLLEAEFGAGRYSRNLVILDVEQDGPWQKVVLAEVPISSDDLAYEGDRQQQRDFLQQLLHPDLSSTVPTSMSGGFFSGQVGQTPTLPNGFTGFSLDAQNGLQLWKNGQLIARYGSDGGAGVMQAYSGYQPVDSTHKAILRFELPANAVNIINKVNLSFSLKAFRATQQATSAGGSAHNHTFTGSSTSTTAHAHSIRIEKDATGLTDDGFVKFGADNGLGHPALFLDPAFGSVVSAATLNDNPAHSHDLSGVTSSNESTHTHNLNSPNALYETGMAQGVHVYVDGTDRTSALGGPWGSGTTIDVSDLDITQWISATGWHEVMLSSTTLGVILAQITTKAQLNTI